MSESEPHKSRFNWRTYTMVTAIVIVHVAAIYVLVSVYLGYRAALDHMSDFSAMHATHDAIRLHTERTGEWPENWEDLEPDLRELNVDDVDGMQRRVEVDFSLTPEDLDANPQANVIRLRSGWDTSELPELNRLLRERLTKSSHR